MIFQELRDALNEMSDEDLSLPVTAFSKFWLGEEEEIYLDRDERGPYLYVMVAKEKKQEEKQKFPYRGYSDQDAETLISKKSIEGIWSSCTCIHAPEQHIKGNCQIRTCSCGKSV
jgi:hypothetical protein